MQTIGSYVPEIGPLVANILGFVAVIISLWLFVKWFNRPMGARLQTVLERHDEIAILVHPDPDPDALASAMGLKHVASMVDTDSTIQYSGQIRHQENRVFQNILEPAIDRIKRVDEIAADAVVLVDHNELRGFEQADKIMPIAVIDHHPGDGTGLEFTDKRTSYGSCSSIVAEYLDDIGVTPVHIDDIETDSESVDDISDTILPPKITTGLRYGIQSDTDSLTSGAIDADYDAASYLSPGVDETLLNRIANPEIDTEVLDIKSRAISNRDERGPFLVSDVGDINNTDAISQAADQLVLLEGVTAAVVYGSRDGTTHVSGRSHDDRIHMGETLEVVAAQVPEASAGGHARMGGAKFPTPELATDGGNDAQSQHPLPEFTDVIFSALEGDV